MDATLRRPEVDKYIGTGENLGISDKLAFLSCYGDLFIAIIGRNGEGKSLIAQGLIDELKGIPTALVDEYVEADGLLAHLGRCFGLQGSEHRRPPGLGELSDYVSALTQQGKKPVLIVDDAGKFKDRMLRAILTIAERCNFGLVLFGNNGLTKMRSFRSFSRRIYTCRLEKMTDDDLKSYIRRRHEYDLQVSESQLDNILRQSSGMPDKVDRLVDELLESPPAHQSVPLIHISVVVVLALILVGAWWFERDRDGLVPVEELAQDYSAPAVFSAVRVGSGPFEPDKSAGKSVESASSKFPAKARRPVRMVTTPELTPVPSRLLPVAGDRSQSLGNEVGKIDGAVVEGTKNAAITPEGMGIEVVNIEGADIEGADIEGADIEGADIEGADIEGNTEDSKTADKGTEGIRNEGSLDSGKAALAVTGSESNEKPSLRKASGTQVSDRVVAAVNAAQDFPGRPEQVSGQGVRQKNWLSEAQDSDYTLQLMGSHNEDRVQEFIQAQGAGNFAYFETKLRNQSWYVLTVGQYQNREEALLAIRRLPPDLQAQKPWARNVASIRAALQ